MMSQNDLYSYCKVCRINHTQKRKHIFSKKHKNKLEEILQKFSRKIKEVQLFLRNPVIEEGQLEDGCTFWCHFCEKRSEKHVSDNLKTILYGGVLEHLASEEHSNAVEIFCRVNRVEEKQKMKFIVPMTDLDLYKAKLLPLVDEYDIKQNNRTKQIASQIKACRSSTIAGIKQDGNENMSQNRVVYKTVKNEHHVLQNPTGYHDGVRVWKGGIVKYKTCSDQIISCRFDSKKDNRISNNIGYMRTVKAQGEGLSTIKQKANCQVGNIHSGATPPWLLNEEPETNGNKVIGPTQLDFEKYAKQRKRSKLNPNRVGVNFDHSGNVGEDWLPSFGRVWNEGARWKSRQQYYKESGKTRKKGR